MAAAADAGARDASPSVSPTSTRLPELNDNPYFSEPPTSVARRWLPKAVLDHCNYRDLTAVLKCSVAIWVCTIIIVIEPSLRAIGQATFFAPIVLLILPPSGALLPGLLGGATMVVGCCVGWAWGTISMKAALATRPQAELQQRFAQLQQAASRQTTNVGAASGQTQYAQVAIFNGFMLDVRVSATYFCMMGLLVYLMARLRIKVPTLALVSIFAIIISDIYLTIAPLIPTFVGTIPETLLKPAGVAIGVGAICNMVIFPRSATGLVLAEVSGITEVLSEFLAAFELSLLYPDAELLRGRLHDAQGKLIAHYKSAQGLVGFLGIDATFGALSAQDIKSLWESLLPVMYATNSLLAGCLIHADHHAVSKQFHAVIRDALHEAPDTDGGINGQSRSEKREEPLGDLKQGEVNREKSSLTDLRRQNINLAGACKDAATALSTLQSRFGIGLKQHSTSDVLQDSEQTASSLRTVLSNAAGPTAETTENTSAAEHSGHDAGDVGPWLEQSIHDVVVQARLRALADALEVWLSAHIHLAQSRSRKRFWLPGQGKPPSHPNEKQDKGSNGSGTTSDSQAASNEDEKNDNADSIFRQLDTTLPTGGRQRNRAGQVLKGVITWFTNTEGAFALRTLICTIGLAVIAVVPASAGFFYREKGLWGLIMSQTGLAVYGGDFVFGVIARVVGTILGGVVGMVAWYIGAGNGPGNPYGIAAIMVPIIIALVGFRLFLPAQYAQAAIMAGATIMLVVGYSWSDTHIPSYGNPGVGYTVFWRRTLLVLTGFAAAALVTLVPKPPSANRHYRRVLSDQLTKLDNMYGLFLRRSEPDGTNKAVERSAISILTTLLDTRAKLPNTRLEYSSSNIDAETLQGLANGALNLTRSIATIILNKARLQPEFKRRFNDVSGVTDQRLSYETRARIAMIKSGLLTSTPLPPTLPLLSTQRYEKQELANSIRVLARDMKSGAYSDHDLQPYCACIVALTDIYQNLDNMVELLHKVLGETAHARADNI